MYIILIIILLLIIFTFWILNFPVFGKYPSGNRLKRIQQLPNYNNGEIKNLSPTTTKPDDISYWQMIRKVIEGNKEASPSHKLPHATPDLSQSVQLKITWFGHSSYLIQVEEKNILVDPVFSKRTSPFQFLGTKSFKGTDFIKPEDFPALDLMIITHDHYDHLDYASILKLKSKTKRFLTSLGVGEHLIYWGINANQITELAWGESTSLIDGFNFIASSARHFSGRAFKRNQSLWSSFIMKTPKNTVFIGGDSGYDTHFKEIGEEYGPFDLAILECGQYNTMWPLIHMFPEEVAQAAIDLKSNVLMPVHWGKFRLALHNWDDPIKRVVAKSDELGVKIITPMLGESVLIGGTYSNMKWWENV